MFVINQQVEVVQKVFAENASNPAINVPMVHAVHLKHLDISDRQSPKGNLFRDTSDVT